jgi:hypothetical protein
MATQKLIPARRGAAARVAAGQRVKVINTHGTQVVDTWAFSAGDVNEWMSMEASRAWFLKLRAAVGDAFLSNQRRPHPHSRRGHLRGRPRHPHGRLRPSPLSAARGRGPP